MLIGSTKHRYFVHKSLLAAKSLFFRTMFKECWDGEKEEVELAQIHKEGFEVALNWMYSGSLPHQDKIHPDGWETIMDA